MLLFQGEMLVMRAACHGGCQLAAALRSGPNDEPTTGRLGLCPLPLPGLVLPDLDFLTAMTL